MCDDWSNRYLRNIVVQWFDRSQDAKKWPSVFDRFIFLWIAFDAWSSNESGRTKSEEVTAWLKTSRLAEVFRRNVPRIDDHLQRLSRKGDIPGHVGKKRPERLIDPHDFGQVMKVTYRIRNNLFHGHKAPDDKDDQEFVTLSHSVLSPLLQPFVDELRGW